MMDHSGTNFKKQFKRADKSGAHFTIVIGEDEVLEQQLVIKDLTGKIEQKRCTLAQAVLFLQQELLG